MTIFSEREGERDRDITSVRYLSVHACMYILTYMYASTLTIHTHTHYSMYMCHDCVCCVSQCLDLYLTFNVKPRENICTIGLLQ